jgi:hypothetical protein
MNNLENISKRNGQTDILNNVDINLFHINIHKLVICVWILGINNASRAPTYFSRM